MRNLTMNVALALLLALCACSREGGGGQPAQNPGRLVNVRIFENVRNECKWKVVASSATLNEKTAVMRFFSPRLKFFENGKTASVITADTGTIKLENRNSVLTGNVRVDSKKENSILETSRLSHREGKIFTNEKVVIRRKDAVIRGSEMTANPDLTNIEIKNQEMEILSR